MGNHGNLEYFLNKSRKELQKLCKSYSIPSNQSHSELAKSLAIVFKRSVSTALPSGTSSRSLNTSQIPEPKTTDTNHKETVSGTQEGQNSYEDHILGRTSDNNIKMPSDFLTICKTTSPVELPSKNAALAVEKAPNSATPVFPSVNNKSSEGIGSTSMPEPTVGKSLVATDSYALAKADSLLCHKNENKKGQKRSLELNVDQQLPCHIPSDSRTCNGELLPCGHKRARQSVFVSDRETTKKIPSFQFFVTSERGIDLRVDFSSPPRGWIKNMKNEHCIHQSAGYEESRTLFDHLNGLPIIEDNVDVLSSRDTRMNHHSNVSGDNLGCIVSSLNSVVSENCNSDNSTPDVTAASSRSSILKLDAAKDNLNACLEENQVVFSSCATYVVENQSKDDPASSTQEQLLDQDCAKTDAEMITGNELASDASLKSITNTDIMNLSPIDCDAIHTAYVVSDSAKVTETLGQNQFLPVTDLPTIDMEKNSMEVLQEVMTSAEASSMGQQIDKIPDNAVQLPDQMLLNPVTDAQSEVGTTDNLLPEQSCGVGKTLIPNDLMPKVSADTVKSTMPNKINLSECSRVQKSLNKNLKASNDSEFSEMLHSSKDPTCKENVNGNRAGLRSAKYSSKFTASGSTPFPRRSSRLLPK